MSGIYIQDMQMPKSCGFCHLRMMTMDGDECGIGARITEYQKRPDDCPLIPVPDHGRLIDADALEEELYTTWMETEDYEFANHDSWKTLHSAPTIIPADKEADG